MSCRSRREPKIRLRVDPDDRATGRNLHRLTLAKVSEQPDEFGRPQPWAAWSAGLYDWP